MLWLQISNMFIRNPFPKGFHSSNTRFSYLRRLITTLISYFTLLKISSIKKSMVDLWISESWNAEMIAAFKLELFGSMFCKMSMRIYIKGLTFSPSIPSFTIVSHTICLLIEASFKLETNALNTYCL